MWIFDNFFANKESKTQLSHSETILKAMQENTWKNDWKVKDFQNGEYFVGYKAPVAIARLKKKGLIENGEKQGRFQTYKITDEGLKYIIPKH